MALDLEDFLALVRRSRQHFLKHVDGLSDDQWRFKPYPECKSVRETIVHLIWVDRSALESLETGTATDWMPLYDRVIQETQDLSGAELLVTLRESHARVLAFFEERHAQMPLDTEISMWGSPGKLAVQLAYLTAEDHYHAGQVAFIRMATDPDWAYYPAIYS
jgi:uncharacterized damage-inducible protein DinB